MAVTLSINGANFTYPETGERQYGDIGTAAMQEVAKNSLLDFTKAVFVSKDGNNSNSGFTPNKKAKLTFGAAITLAATLSPSSSNRISVVCLDGGIYTEGVTCQSFIDIVAPGATIKGTIDLVDDVRVQLYEVSPATGNAVSKQSGTGQAFINIIKIISANADGIEIGLGKGTITGFVNDLEGTTAYMLDTSSTLNLFVGKITGTESPGLGIANVIKANLRDEYLIFTIDGVLQTGEDQVYIDLPFPCDFEPVDVKVGTAPVGAGIEIDINKNGITIFTTQSGLPGIIAENTTDTSDAPDVTSGVKGDRISVSIDQVGTTTNGSDLNVRFKIIRKD